MIVVAYLLGLVGILDCAEGWPVWSIFVIVVLICFSVRTHYAVESVMDNVRNPASGG